MRILCVCSSWRVFGAETITLKTLDGLRREGHSVHAVTSIFTNGDLSRRLASLGVPETVVPMGALSKKLAWRPILWTSDALMRLPELWVRFHRLMREFKPDILLLTSNKQAVWLYPWLGSQPSLLIEYTNFAPTATNRWLCRKLSHRLSRFIAVSEFMRSHLVRLGAPLEKVCIIRSGAFSRNERHTVCIGTASPPPCAAPTIRLGIVGQIAPNKGHDSLLEAVKVLREQGVHCEVKVFGAGNPEYVSEFKARVSKEGLSSAWIWEGYERDKAKIFGSFDLAVVPSVFGDPFPTVAMEAGAYGLPVLASRQGGLPEIIDDGVTGWLVDANAPAQLAEKIRWTARNPDLAKAMGAAGRERVFENFTVEKMVSEFEALFCECLKEERGRTVPC